MRTIKVDGYHGTALKNADSILATGFESSVRLDHWLGQGFYFFSDFDLALWWIKTKIRSKDGARCAVINVSMECDDSLWLDLDTVSGINYFIEEVNAILRASSHLVSLKFDASKLEDDQIRIRHLCFALDLLKKFRNIQLVAMTFRKDKPRYAAHSIADFEEHFFTLPWDFTYQERQICSTSNDIVTSKKVVFPN